MRIGTVNLPPALGWSWLTFVVASVIALNVLAYSQLRTRRRVRQLGEQLDAHRRGVLKRLVKLDKQAETFATADQIHGLVEAAFGVGVAQEIARQMIALLKEGAIGSIEELITLGGQVTPDPAELVPDALTPLPRIDTDATPATGCSYYRTETGSRVCGDPGCDRCNPATGPIPLAKIESLALANGHAILEQGDPDYPRALVTCPETIGYVTTTPEGNCTVCGAHLPIVTDTGVRTALADAVAAAGLEIDAEVETRAEQLASINALLEPESFVVIGPDPAPGREADDAEGAVFMERRYGPGHFLVIDPATGEPPADPVWAPDAREEGDRA